MKYTFKGKMTQNETRWYDWIVDYDGQSFSVFDLVNGELELVKSCAFFDLTVNQYLCFLELTSVS